MNGMRSRHTPLHKFYLLAVYILFYVQGVVLQIKVKETTKHSSQSQQSWCSSFFVLAFLIGEANRVRLILRFIVINNINPLMLSRYQYVIYVRVI